MSQDGFVTTKEIIYRSRLFLKLLERIRRDLDFLVQVLLNIVDHYLLTSISIAELDISHNEILLNGSWQHAVSTIINVLADDVDATWSSAIVSRLHAVQLFESLHDSVVPRLMLLLHRIIYIQVDIVKGRDHGNW